MARSYLEKVRDLLNPDATHKPRVREHAITGPYVEDLTSHAVSSFEMVSQLMAEGNRVCWVSLVTAPSQSCRCELSSQHR
jgi:hypothetical protein